MTLCVRHVKISNSHHEKLEKSWKHYGNSLVKKSENPVVQSKLQNRTGQMVQHKQAKIKTQTHNFR